MANETLMMTFENNLKKTFLLTKNLQVLMVQYKLIHRILAVNHNLKKWEKIESDRCDSCDQVDTIEHFIYNSYAQQPRPYGIAYKCAGKQLFNLLLP